MELDSFLHKVQGVLKNEQKILGTLNMIKKENKEDLTKIVSSLNKIIENEDINHQQLEKLYILLFLNTDTDVYNDLKKHRKYSHLVGFLPKLSQDLFIKIVVDVQLHQCLYESVQYFCSSLSFQILEISLNALKWIDLFDSIIFVESLITSLFHKIVKSDEKDKYTKHLIDIFQRLLLHYDAEKGGTIKRMGLWKSSKLKHYAGLVMASLLSVLQKCTNIYYKKEYINNNSIYNVQINEDSVKLNPIESAQITVQECYEHLVAKCLENVCSITIDVWLYWVEIDLDDIPDTENTLQRRIGELAYICRETLREAECAGVSSKEACDLINRLKSIALKPHSKEDQASSLDLEQILANIKDGNKDTHQWLRFLLNNTLFAMDPSALKVINEYTLHLQNADFLKLFKLLFSFIKTNESCAPHKSCVLAMVKCVEVDSLIQVLSCFVDNFGLTNIFKTEEFQTLFVETFNKVINEEEKEKELYPQFVSLALQSPKQVVEKAVAEGITSEVRGHLMADILGKLQPFCDAPVAGDTPLLIAALDKLLLTLPDLPENQQGNFPLFVRELVMRKNLNGEKFIMSCLMKELHLHLTTKNHIVSIGCLETLSELYDSDCTHNCPASLVMLLQVVEANRWTPSNYCRAAVQVCELALQLISQFVTKWFEIGIDEKLLTNLVALVREGISPENRYHLYRLQSDEPMPTDPALQLLYRMHYGIGEWSVLQVTPEERPRLVYSLCYVVPVLTSNEWQELFCVVAPKCSEFLCLFHLVTDSIIICLDAAKVRGDSTVMGCLDFAILNAAQVVKYEVNRWNENDNDYRISVLSKMCQLVSNLPQNHQESFGLTLVKVLQQLLPEGSRRKPLTDQEMNSVTVSIASIQAPKVRQNLAKEFLESVHR